MAEIKVVSAESLEVFEEKLNKIVGKLRLNQFKIEYSAQESYPNGADVSDPERFYTAVVSI